MKTINIAKMLLSINRKVAFPRVFFFSLLSPFFSSFLFFLFPLSSFLLIFSSSPLNSCRKRAAHLAPRNRRESAPTMDARAKRPPRSTQGGWCVRTRRSSTFAPLSLHSAKIIIFRKSKYFYIYIFSFCISFCIFNLF
jgi:hypothetical protein